MNQGGAATSFPGNNMMNQRGPATRFEAGKGLLRSVEQIKAVEETKALVCQLCAKFYNLGWLYGTGGSLSIKVHEENVPKKNQIIIMTPSGAQKEMLRPQDLCTVSSDGTFVHFPSTGTKFSDSAVLFLKIYELRNAGAVIHSHALESVIVTRLDDSAKEFRVKDMEMIKGIEGHGYGDEIVIPIIENAPHESLLANPLAEAISAYPKTRAVLVRHHGVFIWGDTWISAKTQAECYHYLFKAAVQMDKLDFFQY
ncbi:OLC1v1023943C1 [Oldenlandia corymbosa var. corymbosa]|uniref:OLC1v1023943C1 n=1 Tax=Oldenlandia corymbosa var. corymbosa TaxID=529605 RepID=A0AAV1C2T2_OLDCO|nr:OLC1v1023943C1 [Oldenlandia corymbosa var. corymbosa]